MSLIDNINQLKKLDDILTVCSYKRAGVIYARDIKDIIDKCEKGYMQDIFILLWEHLSAEESSFQ